MRWFGRRLAALVAVPFVSMAAAVATPAVSWADCDRNMSWNTATGVCGPPPAPPAWYTPPPPYAPSFAPLNVPPPPPKPWWAPEAPVWSNGFQRWGVVLGTLWVPV
ncbi:hypothetical protein [Mycobacterium sp. 1245805.9]|uniref:hypothetical protein n=1 Tax=Mycobacterium sp. 1245805.9 TaxID=1856862 RepID=UPI0009EE01F8|nr:hypothetical protein [Mycobacterium sp. 1245805.9]